MDKIIKELDRVAEGRRPPGYGTKILPFQDYLVKDNIKSNLIISRREDGKLVGTKGITPKEQEILRARERLRNSRKIKKQLRLGENQNGKEITPDEAPNNIIYLLAARKARSKK